jgi:flagellar biosynthesis protein FlhB
MALFPGVIGLFVMLAIYAYLLGTGFNPRGRVIFLILLVGLLAFLVGAGRSARNIAALIEGTLKRNPDLASTRPVMFVLALLAKAIAALVLIAVGTAALIATIVHVRS